MGTNIKVLIVSLIIGLAHAVFILSRPLCLGGFECMGWLVYIFFGIIFVPIVSGFLGLFWGGVGASIGKRFKIAISWLGLSFAVMLPLTLISCWVVAIRTNIEREKRYPTTEVKSLAPDSPQRKNPLY